MLFDAHISLPALSDADLQNLYYFGITHFVFTLPKTFFRTEEYLTQINTTPDFISYFLCAVEEEFERLQQYRFHARATLAVNYENMPSRAHYDIWENLYRLIRGGGLGGKLVGIGTYKMRDLSPASWEYLNQHRILALNLDLPLIIELPEKLNVLATVEVVNWLVPRAPRKVLFHRVDATMLGYILEAGFHISLSAHDVIRQEGSQDCLERLNRIKMIIEDHHDFISKIMISSHAREPHGNLLAVRNLVDWFEQNAEFPPGVLAKLAFGNAAEFFDFYSLHFLNSQ